MEVIKISPRGYCYGVVDAMVMAVEAAKNKNLPRPIYILGMLVHNRHVVEAFAKEGIITLDGTNRLELLEQVNGGTVIFTAHGISKEVRKRAKEKGLRVIDATCPDVMKTHNLIEEKTREGFEILYIGKKGHPEPEGALGVNREHVHLIENEEDIVKLSLNEDKILITNQTTMSQWDVAHLVEEILKKYPQAEFHKEICQATQIRQEAVAEQAKEADLLIVVGDPKSNNSNRLAQVGEEIAKVKAYRISDVTEIEREWLKGVRKVAVTSGASTPTPITNEVIQYLEQYDENNPNTWEIKRTIDEEKILPKIKLRQ